MIFFSGLFMIAVGFGVFVMFADPVNDKRLWLEDLCAGLMMLGFGVVIIGAVVWIGQVLR